MNHEAQAGSIRTISMLVNHVPRQCGIATFTADLTPTSEEVFPGDLQLFPYRPRRRRVTTRLIGFGLLAALLDGRELAPRTLRR